MYTSSYVCMSMADVASGAGEGVNTTTYNWRQGDARLLGGHLGCRLPAASPAEVVVEVQLPEAEVFAVVDILKQEVLRV